MKPLRPLVILHTPFILIMAERKYHLLYMHDFSNKHYFRKSENALRYALARLFHFVAADLN